MPHLDWLQMTSIFVSTTTIFISSKKQFYSILSHLAGKFGGKLLAEDFWRETFGRKLLAGNFWRETFGGKRLVGNF